MRIQHQASLIERDVQIQAMTYKYKYNPKVNDFIKEVLSINSQLMQQKEVLCQKISQMSPYCEISDKLTSQVVDRRLEYDEIPKNIYEFITSKESEEGRKVDLPKLEESHKDILFTDWDSRLKQAERATIIKEVTIDNIIEAISKNQHGANLVT